MRPFPLLFNASGGMDATKIWIGSTTTNSGTWTVDYSSAGFANAPCVTPIAELSAANVYDRAFASLSGAPSTTNASGYAVRGVNMLVLGASVRTVPDGTKVHIMAMGA